MSDIVFDVDEPIDEADCCPGCGEPVDPVFRDLGMVAPCSTRDCRVRTFEPEPL
jgi:hypothetical protein